MHKGGELIRELRCRRKEKEKKKEKEEEKKATLENVAEKAGITSRALSDIERGETLKPERATLINVLNAINSFTKVTASERNTVFEAFGYSPIIEPPSDAECAQVIKMWREQYSNIRLPMYLVDFTQRLLAWNEYAPRILGMRDGDVRLQRLRNITIFDLAFNPLFIAASKITNGGDFLLQMVSIMKAEMQMFQNEPWYEDLIDRSKSDYPLFKELWENLPTKLPTVPVRTMGPLHVQYREGSILKFQLLGIDFADDPRFRTVQYHPYDGETIKEWNAWIEAEQK